MEIITNIWMQIAFTSDLLSWFLGGASEVVQGSVIIPAQATPPMVFLKKPKSPYHLFYIIIGLNFSLQPEHGLSFHTPKPRNAFLLSFSLVLFFLNYHILTVSLLQFLPGGGSVQGLYVFKAFVLLFILTIISLYNYTFLKVTFYWKINLKS